MRFGIILILFALLFPGRIYADSLKAYQDYIYQADLYRQKFNEFKVAKNEYDKFGTLQSRTLALEKAKDMMSTRDILLRSYLLLLSEKLKENLGLPVSDLNLYQSLIDKEIEFLDNHSQVVQSIASIQDATTASEDLQSHYLVLQRSIRQTIVGIRLGDLFVLAREFDSTYDYLSNLVGLHKSTYPPSKQTTIERWLLSIQDKRSLYERKIETINQKNAQARAGSIDELDLTFNQIQNDIASAKAYLKDGVSFMQELATTLQYAD